MAIPCDAKVLAVEAAVPFVNKNGMTGTEMYANEGGDAVLGFKVERKKVASAVADVNNILYNFI